MAGSRSGWCPNGPVRRCQAPSAPRPVDARAGRCRSARSRHRQATGRPALPTGPGSGSPACSSSSGARPSRNSYEPGERSFLPTPKPVEAFPWGSKSINRTFSPTAARAVARLMAVVVLPTPPFWLAIAKTLGAELGNSEENGVTIGHAGKRLGLNVPVLHGLGQFGLPALAFVEKANSGIRTVRACPSEQLAERSERPGRDDIGFAGRAQLRSG